MVQVTSLKTKFREQNSKTLLKQCIHTEQYQVDLSHLTITADTTFSFLNFPPTGALGRIILDITVQPTSTGILTFPSAVIKADNVTGSDGTSDQVTIGLGKALFEFMSPDGGTTVLMHQLGKQYV